MAQAVQTVRFERGWPHRAPYRLAAASEAPDLVARYAQAERDAARARVTLERLLEVCRPAAEEIARTYARTEADAADMVQEALMALARDLPRLREPAAFPHWFATLVHNRCRDWLRRGRARRAEVSLDSPPRPGWLGASEGPQPLDVPDPDAARAFVACEARDHLQSLLRTLPAQQRAALTSAYLEGRSHEQIGRDLGVSPKAVENLVYRALRRLQAVAAQCTDEPQELAVWCPHCGQRRLQARLQPGWSPGCPAVLRFRCPGCWPANQWDPSGVSARRLGRHTSLDDLFWMQAAAFGEAAGRLARATDPRCPRCGGLMAYEYEVGAPWRPGRIGPGGERPLYLFGWRCAACGFSHCGGDLASAATAWAPEWRAFWRSSPRLMLGPQRLTQVGGEAQVALTARDRETGRRATLAVTRDTLEVRRFEVEGR